MNLQPSQPIDLSTVSPGFEDPVMDAQCCYRRLLSCMAQPGQVQPAPRAAGRCPGLMSATVSVALTLFDADTRVWLSPSCRTRGVESYLRFHTGCPIVATPADADFAIVASPSELPSLRSFQCGSAEYPDQSTTVIVQTSAVQGAGGTSAIAHGPGIQDAIEVGIAGVSSDFFGEWRRNRDRFPLGVDLLFVSGDDMLAIPRSTRLEVN